DAVGALFSEAPGRVLVATQEAFPTAQGVACTRIGIVAGDALRITVGPETTSWDLVNLRESYENSLNAAFPDPRNV
ncbi:MAG: hypothetical protein C4320_07420, partial [Armatimonadota bacterium]